MNAPTKALFGDNAKCDVCEGLLYRGETFADCYMKAARSWGLFCHDCIPYKQQFGTGLGQLYRSVDKIKIKG